MHLWTCAPRASSDQDEPYENLSYWSTLVQGYCCSELQGRGSKKLCRDKWRREQEGLGMLMITAREESMPVASIMCAVCALSNLCSVLEVRGRRGIE